MTPPPRSLRVAIVTPVLNDWQCLTRLLSELDEELAGRDTTGIVCAVDDGSTDAGPDHLSESFNAITRVEIIELVVNLGQQRAIVAGLVHAQEHNPDCVIVIDSDGEDRPSDVGVLLDLHRRDPQIIYVAERAKRSESLSFKLFYLCYRFLFWLGTGKNIAHGNFCLIPRSRLAGILHSPDTWNNLAASITRSRIPYAGIRTVRGHRYFGRSRMNFTSLLLHGLSAVSVYLDVFTARLVTTCVLMLGGLFAIGVGAVAIRLFTNFAIPGWTSVVVGLLSIVMLQLLMLSASVLFSLLNARTQASIIPASAAKQYIRIINEVFPRSKAEGKAA